MCCVNGVCFCIYQYPLYILICVVQDFKRRREVDSEDEGSKKKKKRQKQALQSSESESVPNDDEDERDGQKIVRCEFCV